MFLNRSFEGSLTDLAQVCLSSRLTEEVTFNSAPMSNLAFSGCLLHWYAAMLSISTWLLRAHSISKFQSSNLINPIFVVSTIHLFQPHPNLSGIASLRVCLLNGTRPFLAKFIHYEKISSNLDPTNEHIHTFLTCSCGAWFKYATRLWINCPSMQRHVPKSWMAKISVQGMIWADCSLGFKPLGIKRNFRTPELTTSNYHLRNAWSFPKIYQWKTDW